MYSSFSYQTKKKTRGQIIKIGTHIVRNGNTQNTTKCYSIRRPWKRLYKKTVRAGLIHTHHFSIAEIQCVPHETLREGIWLLTNVFLIRLDWPVSGHHLVCDQTRNRCYRHPVKMLYTSIKYIHTTLPLIRKYSGQVPGNISKLMRNTDAHSLFPDRWVEK